MKLHYQQNGELAKAGLAFLEYKDVKHPSRKGDVITLPRKGWDMFQLLPDFSQFLLLKSTPERSDSRYTEHRQAWFGGTDNRPFLVELEVNASVGDGECAAWIEVWKAGKFFSAMKPGIIKQYEGLYGKEKTLRQGDIFAYPLPLQRWEEVWCLLEPIYTGLRFSESATCTNLFDTRHILKGKIIFSCVEGQNDDYVIADGVIEAPDHTPLILNKICILAQTENLQHPKQAD